MDTFHPAEPVLEEKTSARDARLLLMAEKLWQALDMFNDGPDDSDVALANSWLMKAMELAREHRRDEPVSGWFLSRNHVNDIVANSLNNLISRAKWCSICDVDLREGGQNKRFEADWIKYMEPVGRTQAVSPAPTEASTGPLPGASKQDPKESK